MNKLSDKEKLALYREVIITLMDNLDGDAFVLGVKGPRFQGKMRPLVRVLGKDATKEWVQKAQDNRDLGHAALDGLIRLNKKGMITYKNRIRALEILRYARASR